MLKASNVKNNTTPLEIHLLKKIFSHGWKFHFNFNKYKTFVKTNNRCKKYENCFEQVFHLPYITRNVKHDCNNKIYKY